jgi:phosphoserine phosphatase
MHTPSTASFLPLADYLTSLRASDPEALTHALFAAHQVLPYLTPPHNHTLSAAILELTPPPEATSQWLESVFFVGGPEAEQVLNRFLLSAAGSPEAALAQTWLQLIQTEKTFLSAPALHDAPAPHARWESTPPSIELLPAMSDARYARVVATDCDGTTWRGDVGDALFKKAVAEGLLLEDANPPLREYLSSLGYPTSPDVHENAACILGAFESGELLQRGLQQGRHRNEIISEYYQCNAWSFAGHSIATIKEWTRALFHHSPDFDGAPCPGVSSMLQTARERGCVVIAVTASNQWSAEVGAALLGIPARHVRGIEPVVEDARITPRLKTPIPYGPGKMDCVRQLTQRAPLLAMGDSFDATDREMLQEAYAAAIITPDDDASATRLKEAALPHWCVLDPASAALTLP